MLKFFTVLANRAENISANIRGRIALPDGVYTGEMVHGCTFDGILDTTYLLTDGAGVDYFLRYQAPNDEITTMLDVFYGEEYVFNCLQDLIGVPVTIEIKHRKGKICIEPYQPVSDTGRSNDYIKNKNNKEG